MLGKRKYNMKGHFRQLDERLLGSLQLAFRCYNNLINVNGNVKPQGIFVFSSMQNTYLTSTQLSKLILSIGSLLPRLHST